MPGIAGTIGGGSRGKNEKNLRAMIACLMHEPFYVSGTFVDEAVGIYGGWVSHPNSFAECMPVFNERKDVALIISGENFLDGEAVEDIRRQGHDYGQFDPKYLLHMYEDDTNEFLRQLNGWFSGVLLDRRENKVVLFNDRYGMGRIYYHESNDSFYFSSEAKALLKIKAELREIDLKSLGEMFACGCVLDNKTLFRNIRTLPGGSAWTFLNGNCVKKDSYFSPASWEERPVLGKEVFYQKLKEVVTKVVPRYFVAKDPIALSLTGGLDTRLIMAYRQDSHTRFLVIHLEGKVEMFSTFALHEKSH
jgi:asparagine synthase (glutamine-hydrolysing)